MGLDTACGSTKILACAVDRGEPHSFPSWPSQTLDMGISLWLPMSLVGKLSHGSKAGGGGGPDPDACDSCDLWPV